MDKSNFLADDFQQVARKSDDAVFELLKQKEREKSQPERKAEKVHESSSPKIKRKVRRPESSGVLDSTKKKSTKPESEKTSKPPREWGRPVAILNTRIPQELADLIDDRVYHSKKSGQATTKQAITIEALTRYLVGRRD